MLTLDHATYLRRVERVPYFPNGSDELADASAEASRECDVIVLAHHGCSTLGATVEMAWRRALNLEEAASQHVPLPPARRHDDDVPAPTSLGPSSHR